VVGVLSVAVVILSGGLDSSTAAYWAHSQGYGVHCLTFKYGQRAQREVEAARQIAGSLGVPHKVVDLSSLEEVYRGATSLVDQTLEVSKEFTPNLIVPFRNGVFLSVAVAYADSIGANTVIYGAHGDDEPFYPDCREEFYRAFQEAARLGTGRELEVFSPWRGLGKADIVARALELGVPLEKTWSCYLEGPIHCGVCESCVNRRKAFQAAGVADPTEYASG